MAVGAIVSDGAWLGELRRELFAQLAGVFAQARSRFTAFAYIGALLSEPGDRRSCWQLAEQAGHATPRLMQALLAALQRFITTRLGDPGAILAIDETAELKKGTATVGVARQYAGITGQVENCQAVVFAAYVTARCQAGAGRRDGHRRGPRGRAVLLGGRRRGAWPQRQAAAGLREGRQGVRAR